MVGQELKRYDVNSNKELSLYYYLHDETACYYCIVQASDSSIKEAEKLNAYYKAIAREKNTLVKVSDYINTSKIQYRDKKL